MTGHRSRAEMEANEFLSLMCDGAVITVSNGTHLSPTASLTSFCIVLHLA